MRKYIAYAQKYVNPHISQDAKTVLTHFYVELRKQFASGDHTPVTARQLHSLIRLTEARAKVELREEATEDDAKDVVEIMRHSLLDVFSDEAGGLDTTRSPMGSGMSYKNQVSWVRLYIPIFYLKGLLFAGYEALRQSTKTIRRRIQVVVLN